MSVAGDEVHQVPMQKILSGRFRPRSEMSKQTLRGDLNETAILGPRFELLPAFLKDWIALRMGDDGRHSSAPQFVQYFCAGFGNL